MKRSLSKKLYGAAAICFAALIGVAAMSFVGNRILVNGHKALADSAGAQRDLSLDAENELGIAIQGYKNFLIRGDEKYSKQFREHVRLMADDLTKYEKLISTEEERNTYENAKHAFDRLRSRRRQPGRGAKKDARYRRTGQNHDSRVRYAAPPCARGHGQCRGRQLLRCQGEARQERGETEPGPVSVRAHLGDRRHSPLYVDHQRSLKVRFRHAQSS